MMYLNQYLPIKIAPSVLSKCGFGRLSMVAVSGARDTKMSRYIERNALLLYSIAIQGAADDRCGTRTTHKYRGPRYLLTQRLMAEL